MVALLVGSHGQEGVCVICKQVGSGHRAGQSGKGGLAYSTKGLLGTKQGLLLHVK